MISVVIPTLNDEAVLGRALAALVPAAISGVVREVIVADGGSTDATLEIADEAGCRILAGQSGADERTRAAVGKAQGDWVMLLKPSMQLLPGWEPEIVRRIEAGEAASLPVSDPAASGPAAWLSGLLNGARAPEVLVVRRDRFVDEGRPKSVRRVPGWAHLIRAAV